MGKQSTGKRITLTFAERTIILDELRKVCKKVKLEDREFALYDEGWTDNKVGEAVRDRVPQATDAHVSTVRREIFGEQVRAPMNGGRPDSAWYKRIISLEMRIKSIEDQLGITPPLIDPAEWNS